MLDAWKAQPRERGLCPPAPRLELPCKHMRSCAEIRGAVGRACGWPGETEGRRGLAEEAEVGALGAWEGRARPQCPAARGPVYEEKAGREGSRVAIQRPRSQAEGLQLTMVIGSQGLL